MTINEMLKDLTPEQTVWYIQTMRSIRPDIEKLKEVSTQWQSNSPKA